MKKRGFLFLGILLVGTVFAFTMEQGLKVTILTGDINIISPMQDNIYDDRRIPVIILLSEEAEYLKVSDNGGRFRNLCRNCDSLGFWSTRIMGFDEGFHELEFVAVFSDRTVSQNVSFFIDSKDPTITKTTPARNQVTNGSDFSVKYTESNVKEILLIWNPTINLTGQCASGEDVICNVPQVDLTAFDGQEIEYWFNVTDIADNTDSSIPTKVLVDTTSPLLTVNAPVNTAYGRRVPFNLSVSEDVTLDLIDNSDLSPTWKRICSNCNSYGLTSLRTKSFKTGMHDIVIRATDKAGNSDSEAVSLDVA